MSLYSEEVKGDAHASNTTENPRRIKANQVTANCRLLVQSRPMAGAPLSGTLTSVESRFAACCEALKSSRYDKAELSMGERLVSRYVEHSTDFWAYLRDHSEARSWQSREQAGLESAWRLHRQDRE